MRSAILLALSALLLISTARADPPPRQPEEEPAPWRQRAEAIEALALDAAAPSPGVLIRDGGMVLPPELLGSYTALEAGARDAHPRVRELALRRMAAAQEALRVRWPAAPSWFREIQREALEDPDSAVRAAAAAGLAAGDAESAALAATALCDEAPQVRLAAIEGLAPHLDRAHLSPLLLDPSRRVADAAAEAWGTAPEEGAVARALAEAPICDGALSYRLFLWSPALAASEVSVTLLSPAGAELGRATAEADASWVSSLEIPVTAHPAAALLTAGGATERVPLAPASGGVAAGLCERYPADPDFSRALPSDGALTPPAGGWLRLAGGDERGVSYPALTPAGWSLAFLPAVAASEGCIDRAVRAAPALDPALRQRWLDAAGALPGEQRAGAMSAILALSDEAEAQALRWIETSGHRSETCRALVPALVDTGLAARPALRSWLRGCLDSGDRGLMALMVQAVDEGLLAPEALAAIPERAPSNLTRPVIPALEALLQSEDLDAADRAFHLLTPHEGLSRGANIVRLSHTPGYVSAVRVRTTCGQPAHRILLLEAEVSGHLTGLDPHACDDSTDPPRFTGYRAGE